MKSTDPSGWEKLGMALGLGAGITLGCIVILLKLAILALVAYGLYLLVT